MRVPKKKVRIRINILELQAEVDPKALVRSRNRTPSTPYPGSRGGWRRA